MLIGDCAQDAGDVSIFRDLSPDPISWCCGKAVEKCLDVLKILYSLDPDDYEMVPLPGVAVACVSRDPPMQIGGETHIVQVLALGESVDARVAPHQLLQLVLKHGALEELNGKPAGHALYQGTFPTRVNATALIWAHGSVLRMVRAA